MNSTTCQPGQEQHEQKLAALADLICKETLARLTKEYPHSAEAGLLGRDSTVTIKPGTKYTRVDVGRSGKYMVDAEGNIYGIKGYGVVHRGHRYGTLDTVSNYYWGGYVAVEKNGRRIA